MRNLTRYLAIFGFLIFAATAAIGASQTSVLKNNLDIKGNLIVRGSQGLTLTTPLTKANLNNSVKRMRITVPLSPATGAAADSTVYRALVPVGRACTVTGVSFVAQTPPTVGVDTLKALKGSSAGNTMLSAATFDANTLVANTTSNMTLTSTTADLAIPATTPIYLEYSQGTASVDAIAVYGSVEVEVTDY